MDPNLPTNVPQPVVASVINSAPTKPIGRFRGSYLLMTESLELLNKDKEIMWFPILTLICNLVVVFVCGILVILFVLGAAASKTNVQGVVDQHSTIVNVIIYGIIFILYLLGAFISAFFQAGLVTIVHGRISGNSLTFKDGMANAKHHAGKIFKWSLFTATVGVLLELIASRGRIFGKIISAILGTAWNIITLFIVPVLVLEELPVGESIKRSGSIFKKTWGETLIMNFSVSFFFQMISLLVIVIWIALLFTFNGWIMLGSTIIALVLLTALAVFGSTLSAVFKVVLYEYAASGRVPDSFTPQLILGAVKSQI